MMTYAELLAALTAAHIDLDDLLFEHGYVGIRIQEDATALAVLAL